MKTTNKPFVVAIHTPNRIIEVGKPSYDSYEEALKDAEYASEHGTNTYDEKYLRESKEVGQVVITITDSAGVVIWFKDFENE
jgi:hypothetical protein